MYHNATAQNFCTRNQWNFKTTALESWGHFFLLILPWANGDTAEDKDSHRLQLPSALLLLPHLLWRLKLFSLSICQVKTWDDPTSRASNHFWSTQVMQGSTLPMERRQTRSREINTRPSKLCRAELETSIKWSLIILFWDFCLPPQSLPDTVPSKAGSWPEPAGLGATQAEGFLNISCCIPAICSVSASQPSPIILLGMGEKGRNIPQHFSRLIAEHAFSFCRRQIQLQIRAVVSKFSVVTSEHRLKISWFILTEDPALDFSKTRCLIFFFICGTLPTLRYFMFASCQSQFGKHSFLT